MSEPTGWTALCRCGSRTGAIDRARTSKEDLSRIIQIWLITGKTIEPQFGDSWAVDLKSCECAKGK